MAKLLIAEDDRLLRWSLETTLSRDGHDVHAVESGDTAIAAVTNDDYRVVVTDYTLPKADGLQVLLRAKARNSQIHVIVITADGNPELEKLARDMGAIDFLEKPFPLSCLTKAVERALAIPERRSGPRGCCGQCVWENPCGRWAQQAAGIS
jgi:DNA-binding NtrC family response regulator